MAETHKSRSYIDITDEGDIYIETGNDNTPITKLGRGQTTRFVPYSNRVQGINILHIYNIVADYVPAKFEDINEFIYALEQQSVNNEYIHNWINLGAEQLFQFMDNNGLIDDNLYFMNIQSNSNISDLFFEYLTQQIPDKRITNAIMSNDDFDPEDLEIDSSAPKDVKEYLEDLFYQVNRMDRTYTFEQLDLKPKYLKFINGFVNVNRDKLADIPNSASVMLVSNFFSSRSLMLEAHRKLEEGNISILGGCVVAKKDAQ